MYPIACLVDIEGYVIGVAGRYTEVDRKKMKALISSLLPRVEL
jgi:hypothetical protein